MKKGMNKHRDENREKLTKLTLKSEECIKKCTKVQNVAADILKVILYILPIFRKRFFLNLSRISFHFLRGFSKNVQDFVGILLNSLSDWRNVS